MKSKHVLIFHTSLFILFALASLSSPILAIYYPSFFSSIFFLLGIVLFMIAVIASWPLFGGCPFTVWENRLRKNELRETYLGACIDHYTEKWLGLKLPHKFFTGMLVVLLLVPIFVSLFVRYIK